MALPPSEAQNHVRTLKQFKRARTLPKFYGNENTTKPSEKLRFSMTRVKFNPLIYFN